MPTSSREDFVNGLLRCRLVRCRRSFGDDNSKLETIYPDIEDVMTEGRCFEEILQTAAAREMFLFTGEDLDRSSGERLDQHLAATGIPFQQPLADGRWVQVIETRTGDGGIITAWSDITWLKRREAALALLLQSDPDDESFFEVATEALSTGLDCRWTGIGKLSDERFEVLATQGSGWPDTIGIRNLNISPGGKVIESRSYLAIPDRVSELFPDDKVLAELGVVSYQGHAFLDGEGNVLGHVFAMNDRPEKASSHDRELVGLIARWVGAEFERRRAKRDLRESEAGLANAQRIARLGNWDWNVANGELTWSEEVYRIFDRDPDRFEPTYKAFLNAVHPEDRPLVQKAVSNALAGHPYSLDHRIILPDGDTRIIHEQGEVEFDKNGKAAVMHGIVHDVTEYREAVNAVRAGERHVRAIMENVADSLVTIDEAGIIRSVNPAVERMFGYKAAELIGENVKILMPDPHRIEHDDHLRRYLATGSAKILGVAAREFVGQRKDGSPIDVELTVSEMWYGGDRLFIGVLRDITARKQADEALRQKTAFIELSKTTAAAANEASSVEEVLETCVAEVCRHFGWPAGHAYVPAQDGSGELSPSMIWHLTDPEKFLTLRQITMRSRFAPGQGLPGRVLATRGPVWITDVRNDANFPRAQAGEDIGVTAAISFPVLIGTEVAAGLEFFAEDAIEPDEAALDAMTHIGKQIGRVIERARAERDLLTAKTPPSAPTARRASSWPP